MTTILTPMPLKFIRQSGEPLDIDFIFLVEFDMRTYLTNPRRFAGMVVGCIETSAAYVLNATKDAWIRIASANKKVTTYNTDYLIQRSDIDSILIINVSGGDYSVNRKVTLPLNSNSNIEIGSEIEIAQKGEGFAVVIEGEAGVTILSNQGYTSILGNGGVVRAKKTNTNEWFLTGDLKEIPPPFQFSADLINVSASDVFSFDMSFNAPTNIMIDWNDGSTPISYVYSQNEVSNQTITNYSHTFSNSGSKLIKVFFSSPSILMNLQTSKSGNVELNTLSSLAAMNSLISLNQANCSLHSLNTLPDTLAELYIDNNTGFFNQSTNQLGITLPSQLQRLSCKYCDLTQIQSPLPNSLYYFEASYNNLTTPPVGSGIKEYYCQNNQLTTMPPITSVMEQINLSNNLITAFSSWPTTISANGLYVYLSSNQIPSIPAYPVGLNSYLDLTIDNNPTLTSLPPITSAMFSNLYANQCALTDSVISTLLDSGINVASLGRNWNFSNQNPSALTSNLTWARYKFLTSQRNWFISLDTISSRNFTVNNTSGQNVYLDAQAVNNGAGNVTLNAVNESDGSVRLYYDNQNAANTVTVRLYDSQGGTQIGADIVINDGSAGASATPDASKYFDIPNGSGTAVTYITLTAS